VNSHFLGLIKRKNGVNHSRDGEAWERVNVAGNRTKFALHCVLRYFSTSSGE
jgi:hypothetical protein